MKKCILKLLMSLIILVFIFVFLYVKREPVNNTDIIVLFKIFTVFFLAILLRYLIDDSLNKQDTSKKILLISDVIYKLSYFFIGLILLDHSFYMYHKYLIWKAIVFFSLSMMFLFLFFYLFYNDNENFLKIHFSYEKQSVVIIILKFLIAIGLSLLGWYFVKNNNAFLATLSYLFLFFQLILILKLNKKTEILLPTDKKDNNSPLEKTIFVLLLFAALFFYYMTLINLQKKLIFSTIVYFLFGSLIMSFIQYKTTPIDINLKSNSNVIFDTLYSIIIFIISIFIFSYKLTEIPPGVHGDETLTVKMANRLANGEIFPVILEADEYNGMGILFYYLIGLSGKIFGQNLINARMLSIIVGALGIVFIFLLVKEIFNRRIAIMSSIFLCCFFMQIFYSRMAMQWIWVPSIATIAYYFFLKGFKTGLPILFVISGILLSYNLGLYSAAKVSPFVPMVFVIILFLIKDKRINVLSNWQGIILMIFALLLTFLPIIDYMINFPDKYFKRMDRVALLKEFPSNFPQWKSLIDNILKNIQMFFTESAPGYCHNLPFKPFLDELSAFLVIVGAGYLLITWKKESSLFIILWLFFGMLPGFLSRLGLEDPYPARVVLAIPTIIITLSLGLENILKVLENTNKRIFKYITPLIAIYFFVVFAFYNLRNYFIVFPNDPHTLSYYRYVDKLNNDYIMKNKNKKIYFSTLFVWNFYSEVFEYYKSQEYKQNVFFNDLSLFQLFDFFNNENKDVSIIGEGIYYRMFPIYKEYFFDSKIDIVWDFNFWQFDKNSDIKYCYEWKYPDKTIDLNNEFEWFYMYDPMVRFVKIVKAEIPAANINKTFSLNAYFYKNNNKIIHKQISFPIDIKDIDFDKLIIEGLLDVPAYDNYEFQSNAKKWQLYIDNKKVNGQIELYKGLHRIKIVIDKVDEKKVMLSWKNTRLDNYNEIERKYLINSDKIFGLLATYKIKDRIIYKELQPVVDYRIYLTTTRPAYKIASPKECEIEWNGYINIENEDVYSFKLHNLNNARIYIDNKTVFIKEEEKENIIPIKLEKGKKKIRIIRYIEYGKYDWHLAHAIRFMYKKSGWKEYAPVTYNMLFP